MPLYGFRKLSFASLAVTTLILTGCANGAAPSSSPEVNPASGTQQSFEPGVTTVSTTEGLVSTEWLAANATDPDLVVLHISWEEGVYERGHIPGARKLDWYSGLTGGESPDLQWNSGGGIVNQERFRTVAQELGINQNSKVIVYGETHQLFATWAVWVFKVYGFNNIRLLDGGLQKWTADGKNLSLEIPSVEPGNFEPTDANTNLRAFIDEVVLAAQDTDGGSLIVDNRALGEYSGAIESGARFDGHVASAENVFSFALFNDDGTYQTPDFITNAYDVVGVTDAENVILYCGTGLLASASWFALTQVLGFENVKNYDGSWAEYGNSDDVPIENSAS